MLRVVDRDVEIINRTDFGVFLEFLPGRTGLCHITELVYSPDIPMPQVGDRIDVKLLEVMLLQQCTSMHAA